MKRPEVKNYVDITTYAKALDKYIDWLTDKHNKLVDSYNHFKENQAC